ncbi:hypothetical protein L7F22_051463 [Adiantum nelumboides]|nr:hypothetical protein [Adiantum nelumboides]
MAIIPIVANFHVDLEAFFVHLVLDTSMVSPHLALEINVLNVPEDGDPIGAQTPLPIDVYQAISAQTPLPIDVHQANLTITSLKPQGGKEHAPTTSFLSALFYVKTLIPSFKHYGAIEDMELMQMDVKVTFLHGNLHEDIYIVQLESFEVKVKEHLVCKLKKSFCGLKESPREWYQNFDAFFRSQGFRRSEINHCLVLKEIKIIV